MKLKERYNSGINIFRQKSSSCNFNCCCCCCCCCKQASFEGQPQQQHKMLIKFLRQRLLLLLLLLPQMLLRRRSKKKGSRKDLGGAVTKYGFPASFSQSAAQSRFNISVERWGETTATATTASSTTTTTTRTTVTCKIDDFLSAVREDEGTVSLRSAHTCYCTTRIKVLSSSSEGRPKVQRRL